MGKVQKISLLIFSPVFYNCFTSIVKSIVETQGFSIGFYNNGLMTSGDLYQEKQSFGHFIGFSSGFPWIIPWEHQMLVSVDCLWTISDEFLS